jgi:hypothetical protein
VNNPEWLAEREGKRPEYCKIARNLVGPDRDFGAYIDLVKKYYDAGYLPQPESAKYESIAIK